MMMKLVRLFMAALLLVAATACGGSNQKKERALNAQNGKTLVVFFSHAGENYAVGNVKVGNTKVVANYISEITGADQFEIVCVKDYDMPYKPLCDLAKKEQQQGELPGFKGEVKNLDQYATVFIGGPVWWGTYPQVMFTFLEKYKKQLNDKTIVPFTTHEGSGLGNCVSDLKKILPKAQVKGEFSLYGHEVRESKARVQKWLQGLGYK